MLAEGDAGHLILQHILGDSAGQVDSLPVLMNDAEDNHFASAANREAKASISGFGRIPSSVHPSDVIEGPAGQF